MTLETPALLVSDLGEVLGNSGTWCGEATPEELGVLDKIAPPVLDIGCGPGRHVMALALRGVPALGVDAAPSAVRLARSKGAAVLQRSIFEAIPGRGRWGSALLLDGNIGIGGHPEALLLRARELLRPSGRLLVETAKPGTLTRRFPARVESPEGATAWFPWASVDADDVPLLAATSGYEVEEVWEGGGRWFASLRAPCSNV
jgi:SAM-dependent methyltransferase